MSFGEALTFVAIFSTIISVVCTGVILYLQNNSNSSKDTLKKVNNIIETLSKGHNNLDITISQSIETIVDLSKELDLKQQLLESVICRIVNTPNKENIIQDILLKESNISKINIERCFQELNLHSKNTQERISAYRQLSEEFGTHHSLLKLKQLDKTGEEGVIIEKCLARLDKRLTDEQSYH